MTLTMPRGADRRREERPAVAAYRADLDRQEVSKDSRARASHILQALASEAARRGYTVVSAGRGQPQSNSDFRGSLKDGQIRIGVDGFTYQIRLLSSASKAARRCPSPPMDAAPLAGGPACRVRPDRDPATDDRKRIPARQPAR
jgi:hypothetical protein